MNYIDITQLVHWSGRLTGIPRVMNELALRYANSEDTSFIVWDKADACFYELDIDQSLRNRGQGIFYASSRVASESGSRYGGNAKHYTRRAAKLAAKGLKRYQPGLHNKLANRLGGSVGISKGDPIIFGSGDLLFVLWGEWADSSYRNKLVEANDSGVRLANIVYDMLPILAPQYSGHSTDAMNNFYREIIPRCEVVFSISESTKRDLTTWLKNNSLRVPKTVVFRLGDDFKLSKPTKPASDHFSQAIGSSPYVLCVGTIEARKNHTLLYYTYKLAKSRGITLPKLVIVGRQGWRTDDVCSLITTDPETKDLLIPLSDMSDEELAWLYNNCLYSIYPSFYEGWGLPIAESIAHGKVCLSSSTSSMPEVAGSLARYFSPVSTDECLAAMTDLLDADVLKKAEEKIKTYKITSWDETFQQVERGLKELKR